MSQLTSNDGQPNWVKVADKSQLFPNTGVCALVNQQQIAIFWDQHKDQLFAVSNYCPFSKANVLSRGLIGDYQGQSMLAAPTYKQRFNLETGECFDDEHVSIAVYPIKESNGEILIAA
ncbi:nitrite reductase (NAD(P)H) small subunit [Alginatibacterium sediminis]|uniref:Nitrite reductase (NAD(P)H) small subunit n=1 Tax=Alginatibacterium sediminis TaxID=2164068 RepID=A0A420ELE5_9ALTE|nr:nitrite reductase small subunit NirD [Alginatibacterium sediminis]RKF21499.1 nitrite reductase (NAD(P)H) small subunit [Alginatibacterium sediminis]